MDTMKTLARVFAIGFVLSLSSAAAYARPGGVTRHHANHTVLGSKHRTGNTKGNAELADPERKIEDASSAKYGNEIKDPEPQSKGKEQQ